MLAELDLEVFFCGDIEANAWLMYGATEVEPWEHWHNFSFNGATGAEFLADRIVLHLSDDARGDTDYLTRAHPLRRDFRASRR